MPAHAQMALQNSPFVADKLPDFAQAHLLQYEGYADVETGYTQAEDGSIRIAILTPMPDINPLMWDWWFGWHSRQSNRYKLWHPKSHVSAQWQDASDEIAYIGRNSLITEYLGNDAFTMLIQFKSPTEFGFSHEALKKPNQAVYICACIGHPTLPVNYGYLVHQIRAVAGGAEMRSRFWLGGSHIKLRADGTIANTLL